MARLKVVNQLGEAAGTITIADEVIKAVPNDQAVYEVVKAHLAGRRQGTHSTKTVSQVRGGGRKPWRQKGTGRARQGSIRSAQWVGGGVVFGPVPRNYKMKVNRKVVKVALRSILSSRFASGDLIVLEDLVVEPKTKNFVAVLKALELENKKAVFILDGSLNDEQKFDAYLASRNLPNVLLETKSHLGVYDLANSEVLVIAKEAMKAYGEELK